MNNSNQRDLFFNVLCLKISRREVFMTHGYVDSHIIDQALRFAFKR